MNERPTPRQAEQVNPAQQELERAQAELREELRHATDDELETFQQQFIGDREIQALIAEEADRRYDENDRELIELVAEDRGLPPRVGRILSQTSIALERYGHIEPSRTTLLEQGFTPERCVVVDGRELWLSNVLQIEGGDKEICGAYIRTDTGYQLRTFVTSQSQGIWRYYPAYVVHPNGGKSDSLGWYVKGVGEESLGLPWQLQRELARQPRIRSTSSGGRSSLMLMGASAYRIPRSAYEANRAAAHHAAIQQALPIAGTAHHGEPIQGFPKGVMGALREEPEQLDFSKPSQQPNFTRRVAAWRANPPHYGPTTFEVYPSKDGRLHYTIGRTDSGRVWVSHVELNGEEVNEAGLKPRWVDAGVLTAPAIEYDGKQVGRFAGEPIGTWYRDAFDRFQRRLPVVQRYLAQRPQT